MCYKEFIPCRKCKNRKGPQEGYYYDVKDGFTIVRECDCHKKWREQRDLLNRYIIADVNIDYTFDNYVGNMSRDSLECLKQIPKKFKEKFINKKMIYVYGDNGTQKTSMCKCVGKELIDKGFSVKYVLMSDLVKSLVTDFNNSEDVTEKNQMLIDQCMKVDFLIIDEAFDTEKVTLFKSGYQIPFLDTFIRNRFDTLGKSIMFISNKKPTDINNQGFGVSLENLIVRNTCESLLTFKDNYSDNKGKCDPLGLFKN